MQVELEPEVVSPFNIADQAQADSTPQINIKKVDSALADTLAEDSPCFTKGYKMQTYSSEEVKQENMLQPKSLPKRKHRLSTISSVEEKTSPSPKRPRAKRKSSTFETMNEMVEGLLTMVDEDP